MLKKVLVLIIFVLVICILQSCTKKDKKNWQNRIQREVPVVGVNKKLVEDEKLKKLMEDEKLLNERKKEVYELYSMFISDMNKAVTLSEYKTIAGRAVGLVNEMYLLVASIEVVDKVVLAEWIFRELQKDGNKLSDESYKFINELRGVVIEEALDMLRELDDPHYTAETRILVRRITKDLEELRGTIEVDESKFKELIEEIKRRQ
jgi:hypothetical protein